MKDPDRKPGDEPSPRDPSDPAQSAGRRALLVAMPAIFSLHPGAAAAHARVSSTLVLAEEGTPPVDESGNYLCVKKPRGVDSNPKGWEIGRDTRIDVTQIPSNRTYARNLNGECKIATPQEMCANGDSITYYVKTEQRGSYAPLGADEVELFGGKGDKDGDKKKKECGDKPGWVRIDNKVPRGAFASLTALNSFPAANYKNLI